MGRKQPKSNSRRSPQQERQADDSGQNESRVRTSSDAATDAPKYDDYRFITWLAVGGMVVAAICLVLFFNSDVRDKIVASNMAAAQTEAAKIAANRPADGKDGRDGEDGAPGSGSDTPVADLPDTENPDDGADDSEGSEGDNGDTPVDNGTAPSTDIVIAPGAVIDREALTGYLSEMSQDDFIELAESVDMLIADDPTRVNLPDRKSLAEAYAEAEAKYPGQIDASKRLKLVAEINAIDFMYYIAEDGDTLLELSKSLSVPLGQLVELNGIKDADVISAGMVILVPTDMVQPE